MAVWGVVITHALDRLLELQEIIAINRVDASIHLRTASMSRLWAMIVCRTIAFAGLNPGMGSTGAPTRWRVSPIWANEMLSAYTRRFEGKDSLTLGRLLHAARYEAHLPWPEF